MDRTLLQTQIASIVAQVAPATGRWYFTPSGGGATVEIVGTAGTLRPSDPRLSGAGDRHIALLVATSTLPTVRPRKGDKLERDGKKHALIRDPDDEPHGITTILLVA